MKDRTSALRIVTAVIVAIVVLGGLAGTAFQASKRFAPEVQIQNNDYAQVRKQFRTTLTRTGPSHQTELLPQPPEWVDQVEYPSNGLQLKAWISGHQKPGAKLPAVLFLHGGFGFGAADWDMAAPYWAAGFVLMVPMLRGENGLPGTFTFLYDEVDDVLAAADYLNRQPGVDPNRIYLAGHSAGGTLVLLAAEASGRFRAAASFDGSPDQQLLYNGAASKPGIHEEIVFDAKNLRELQVRSPLAYAASFKSPVRLYYSDEASILVHYPNKRLVEVARSRGVDAAAIHVSGSHFTHVAPAMKQSIAFFRRSLGTQSASLLRSRAIPRQKPSLVGNTTFSLKGYPSARVVAVAGSFNGWDSQHFLCANQEGAWVCRMNLPAGKYEYQFVVDDSWIPDPANPLRESDGGENFRSIIVK